MISILHFAFLGAIKTNANGIKMINRIKYRTGKGLLKLMLRILILVLFIYMLNCCDYFMLRLREKDYLTEFNYPTSGDIKDIINGFETERNPKTRYNPIYKMNRLFLIKNSRVCESLKRDIYFSVIILVKSAAINFERRNSIRKTWGWPGNCNHTTTRIVFLLGLISDKTAQLEIKKENDRYQDIVQGDFIDSYDNNTLKTLMGLEWAYLFCESDYYLFADDDYYISTKNLFLFLKDPTKYEEYTDTTNSAAQKYYKNYCSSNGWFMYFGP